MLKFALVLASMIGPPALPVWDGSLPPSQSVKGNYCNVARIVSRKDSAVRDGPGGQYPVVDEMPAGSQVFTCNERWEGERKQLWYGVAYASLRKPCTGALDIGLDIRLSRNCRTGWIRAEAVGVISG